MIDSIIRPPFDLRKLKEPFPLSDVKWRIQQAGSKNGKIWAICIAYITVRETEDRLDQVVGQENWKNEYQPCPGGGMLCGISIKIDGEWITKWDGADYPEIEKIKGVLTDSMKRAGVQWGIGRYLYCLDVGFARISPNGKYKQLGKRDHYETFRWDPPILPSWAQPTKK